MEDTIRYHGFPARLRPEQTIRVIAKEDYVRVHQHPSAHRHSFYEILFVWNGAGQQSIDFNHYTISDCSVFFIQPNQVHRADQGHFGAIDVIIFNEEFYKDTILPFPTDLLFPFSSLQIHLSNLETIHLRRYLDLFKAEYYEDADPLILRNLLEITMKLLGRSHAYQLSSIRTDHRTLLFQKLLERHFRQEHLASFYAHQINLTVKHLNSLVKKDLGKSASTLIKERIVLEIKRLLSYSQLSHKEIAYTLGFRDPSYMSHFFKKYTGINPSQF